MSEEKHGLPGSSIDELIKIIIAYSKINGPATLEQISKLVGVDTTTVSRNNRF